MAIILPVFDRFHALFRTASVSSKEVDTMSSDKIESSRCKPILISSSEIKQRVLPPSNSLLSSLHLSTRSYSRLPKFLKPVEAEITDEYKHRENHANLMKLFEHLLIARISRRVCHGDQ